MQNADQLLRNTFASVKEIAFLSGLRDVSHCHGGFKKQIPPNARRISHLEEGLRRKEQDGHVGFTNRLTDYRCG